MNTSVLMSEQGDGVLLQSYLNGNKQSLDQLIERNRVRVFNYIFSMTNSKAVADDILQETLVKAVQSIDKGKYNDNGKFVSWLLRIAHNQVIDYFRTNKNRRHITSDDVGFDIISIGNGEYQKNVEDDIIMDQTNFQIHQLVDTLPVEQREVVVMRHFMNLSFKEISEQTGVSINTALGRMRYALINLRKRVDQLGLELV